MIRAGMTVMFAAASLMVAARVFAQAETPSAAPAETPAASAETPAASPSPQAAPSSAEAAPSAGEAATAAVAPTASPEKTNPPLGEIPLSAATSPSAIGMQVRQETADALTKPAAAQTPPAGAAIPTAPAPAALAAAKLPQPAATPAVTPPKPAPPPDEIQVFSNTQYRSVMFQPGDVERIKDAMEAYKYLLAQRKLGINVPMVNENVPAQPTVKIIEHPQFYLASVVFHTADDWSIWLNGAKYTSKQPSDRDIIVQDVDKEKARIIWRPTVFEPYKDRPVKPGARVSVDASEGAVTFTLYPNQTFSAFTMKIHEGMLPPVYREEMMIKPPEPSTLQKGVQAVKDGAAAVAPAVPQADGAKARESALTRPDSELFPPQKLPPVPTFQPPASVNR